jgi:chromosome segregation protein
MYLTKLELIGFKSFAQKTILEFDRGIVSIVGPNGSGKSNVADAIRWALGEQSVKLLRGKRSEDVIFSGSHSRARLGMAEVSIFLNNEDRQMPVDYSEIVITRRVYRNGEGEYFLNNAPARLQDIQLLLAKASFGHKSYSVIGQGMIDHILVATPAERKAFFDEAAGVRQFQIKREQAVSKLEQTNENLSQARLLLSEIEPHLRTLTRQVRRLERRGGIENQLQELQTKYFGVRWLDLARQRRGCETVAEKQLGEQKKQQAQLTTLQQELEKLEKEKSRHEVFQELQQQYSRVLEEKNGVMKEQAILEGTEELEAAQRGELNVVWLQNRHRELEHSVADIEEEMHSLETECAAKEKRIHEEASRRKEFTSRGQALAERFAHLQHKVQERRSDPSALEEDFRVFHEEFLAFRKALLEADSERDYGRLKREVSRFEKRFRDVLQKIAEVKSAVRAEDVLALQEEFNTLNTAQEECANGLNGLTREFERKKERLALLRDSHKRLQEDHERTDRELERLSPERSKANTTAAQRVKLEKQIRAYDAELQQLRERIVGFNQAEQQKKERLFELQKSFRERQQALTDRTAELNATRVEIAKIETRQDDLKRELRQELPAERADAILHFTADDTVAEAEAEEKMLADIHHLKHQLELIGGIDEGVTQEYHITEERFQFLSSQVTDMEQSIEKLNGVITELDATIKTQFHSSFLAINREFGKYFKAVFDGGSAKLVLQETILSPEMEEGGEDGGEDGEDGSARENVGGGKPEKIIAGVEIIASPPGKRVTGITMLSGGEKALTSIALISAILSTRPSPFVVLDEVDAALDEANSQRFAAILQQLAKRSQFITITHNRATMQISSLLYGVTMSDDGISKLLSIRMEDAEHVIRQHANR